MRHSLAFIGLLLASCGGPAAKESAVDAPPTKPAVAPLAIRDETRRFPSKDRASVAVVPDHLDGKAYLPGGNLASYARGKTGFRAFLVETASPTAAAILLGDVRKNLQDAKFIPSFGGYFGKDGATPYFVFAKGKWLAGVAGLPQSDADAFAREFAARLN